MTQFEEQVLTDLSELKAHMRWIVGNGNEGKMQELEQRLHAMKVTCNASPGSAARWRCMITLVHLAFDYMRVSHP